MVNIRYSLGRDSFKFSAEGHADYAERGKDIICAVVSDCYNLLERACQVGEKNGFCKFECSEREFGKAQISIKFNGRKNNPVYFYTGIMIEQLEWYANLCPNNITLKREISS